MNWEAGLRSKPRSNMGSAVSRERTRTTMGLSSTRSAQRLMNPISSNRERDDQAARTLSNSQSAENTLHHKDSNMMKELSVERANIMPQVNKNFQSQSVMQRNHQTNSVMEPQIINEVVGIPSASEQRAALRQMRKLEQEANENGSAEKSNSVIRKGGSFAGDASKPTFSGVFESSLRQSSANMRNMRKSPS